MKTTKVVLILRDDSVITFDSNQRGRLALFDAGYSLGIDPVEIKAYNILSGTKKEVLDYIDVFLWSYGLKNLHLS